jgi:hypothetical protein
VQTCRKRFNFWVWNWGVWRVGIRMKNMTTWEGDVRKECNDGWQECSLDSEWSPRAREIPNRHHGTHTKHIE